MSALLLSVLVLAAPGDQEHRDTALGVSFVWADEEQVAKNHGRRIACGAPYREEVDAALPVLRRLFADYGRDVLAKIRVDGARLCRELVYRFDAPVTRVVDGATDIRTEQAVGGLAVFSERRIYVDVAAALRGRSIERVMHHELFHFVDLAIRGGAFDREWRAANPPGARYAGGGFARIGGSPIAPGEHPGFVSPYATASVAEDRAELFAYWRTGRLSGLARNDPFLQKKAEVLAKHLAAKIPALAKRLPRL